LNGGGDYVDCGKAPSLNITDLITVSAWIKVDTFDKFCQAIATKGDSAWRIQKNRYQDSIEFACTGVHVPSDPYGAVRGKTSVNDGKWHHIAGVYDGTRMDLYVDCELDASASARGSIYANHEPLYIGENSERPGRTWKGLIDDVRIYNYALSEAEIKALYDGKGPGTTLN
jgi:beta-galactosidase